MCVGDEWYLVDGAGQQPAAAAVGGAPSAPRRSSRKLPVASLRAAAIESGPSSRPGAALADADADRSIVDEARLAAPASARSSSGSDADSDADALRAVAGGDGSAGAGASSSVACCSSDCSSFLFVGRYT